VTWRLRTNRGKISVCGRCCWSSDVVLLMLSRPTRAATSVIWLKLHDALAIYGIASPSWHQRPSRANIKLVANHNIDEDTTSIDMEYFSLKRSTAADRGQSNLSSKVYVRSTKSGKVQKIVRELYLRQDIPCSSNLCRACLEIAPTDYTKRGDICQPISRGSS
jgi:hypothetical protein